jgi:hypothetical protein
MKYSISNWIYGNEPLLQQPMLRRDKSERISPFPLSPDLQSGGPAAGLQIQPEQR